MPFINSKVTVPVAPETQEKIKSELGKACSIIGKSETYVMIGFEDGYSLYFAGEKLDKGAYISVDLYGSGNSGAFNLMTAKICDIYEKELGIPGTHIYVEYRTTPDWGWNGSNF